MREDIFHATLYQTKKKIWETPYFSLSNATHPWPLPLAGLAYFIFILFYLLQFNGTYNLLLTYILTLIDNNTT